MDLGNPRRFDQRRSLRAGHTAARHDRDAPARLAHQARQDGGTGKCGRRAAGGEHAIDAEADERFERGRQLGQRVECLVEGDRERPRGRDQPPRDLDVDAAARIERTGHEAGRAELAGLRDVGEHRPDFRRRIDVAAAARPDHHEAGNPHPAPRLALELGRRRDPTNAQVPAEL